MSILSVVLKKFFSRFVAISFACTSIVAISQAAEKANALQLPPWSSDVEVSNNPPSLGGHFAIDASEDGTVVAAIWKASTGGRPHVAVGWTDGSQINWTTPTVLSTSQNLSNYYHAISVSGDGRTVVAVWSEQSGDNQRLDDITYAVGAISVDPSTDIPSVTWSNATQINNNGHDWYPSIDVNYDGTKVLITHNTSGPGSIYINAHVGTFTVSGNSRTGTMRGPSQMASIASSHTPSTSYQALWRPSAKISRDGTRGLAAWWDPTTSPKTELGSTGDKTVVGIVEASIGNLDFSTLTFPSSLSGSSWGGITTLSPLEANSYSMPAVDMNDDGTRAIVAWAGTSDGVNHYVSARTVNITSATSGTWTTEVKLTQNLPKSTTHVRANIDAQGSRTFVSWGTGHQFLASGDIQTVLGALGTDASPSWGNVTVLQNGNSHYGVNIAAMSRDGSTAIAMPLAYVSSQTSIRSTASNIWLDGSTLSTDWDPTLPTVTTDIGSFSMNHYGATISKDGSVITLVWTSSTKVLSRVIRLGSPTITAISPTSGAQSGGDTVTITGTNFRPETTVTIGGSACSPVIFVSSTEISCTTGAGTTGASDVVVTNPNLLSDTLQGQFTYNAAPSTPSNGTPSNGNSNSESSTSSQQGSSSQIKSATDLRVTDPTIYVRPPKQVSKNSAITVLSTTQTKTYRITTSTTSTCIPTKDDIVFINEGQCRASILNRKTGKVLRQLRTTVVNQSIQELRVGNEVAVITPIYFANGSSRLTRTAKSQLRRLRNSMTSASAALIMGHTGIVAGNTQENLLLSRKRAVNTINELRKAGVNTSFYAWAMGARDPAVTSKKWSDQKMNRRAVIVLVP